LSKSFLKEEYRCEIAVHVAAARRDLEQKTTSPGHKSTVRRKCRHAQSSTEKKNRLCEVSAYSAVYPEQACGTGQMRSKCSQSSQCSQIRIRRKNAIGSMPR
jgi:hypothetical protein